MIIVSLYPSHIEKIENRIYDENDAVAEYYLYKHLACQQCPSPPGKSLLTRSSLFQKTRLRSLRLWTRTKAGHSSVQSLSLARNIAQRIKGIKDAHGCSHSCHAFSVLKPVGGGVAGEIGKNKAQWIITRS